MRTNSAWEPDPLGLLLPSWLGQHRAGAGWVGCGWAGSGRQDPQTYRAVDLAATHDVIQEGVDPVELPGNAVGKATGDPSPHPTPPRKAGPCVSGGGAY